ncbi:MAG: polyprenyl synthetase family protein [Oscillospiraceae bacterium]|nr:polyprenyl synthetase family protein [Oscillospiraceae bacterium]
MKNELKSYVSHIESYLDGCFDFYEFEPQGILFDSMRYSLLAGGKRLRPVFVFDFCRMAGGCWPDATPFAAAVEMIHTYSLIHDDLPSMDNDDFRRGRPTNHKVYGEAMAILAGDAMLTSAFGHIANAPSLSADAKLRAVSYLSRCAGETGMVGGQVLDILAGQRECTEQEILNIQNRKTGALIKAACVLGVMAANGTAEQEFAAMEFADHLGLAFQIRDDMLDVIGDAEKLGKATGMDGAKNTFVRLYGLEKCEDLVKEHTEAAIDALDVFEDSEFMRELAMSLVGREM